MIDRKKIKTIAILREVAKLIDLSIRAQQETWPASLAYLPSILAQQSKISRMAATQAELFGANGKIDKRRYRRLYRKRLRTASAVIIKPNQERPDIAPILKACDLVQSDSDKNPIVYVIGEDSDG